jgi:hypothetical protein
MPFVVMDMETSIITGPAGLGQPAAIGFGVMIRRVPPQGATEAVPGSEDSSSTWPRSTTRGR